MSIRLPETTKAIRAARAAGIEHFDVAFDSDGRPIIRVRPEPATPDNDVDAELAELDRTWNDAA